MDQDKKAADGDLPWDDREIAKEGERNRKEMDRVPEHGTDPLHEGP